LYKWFSDTKQKFLVHTSTSIRFPLIMIIEKRC